MSSAKEDTLSPDELRKRLYQTFKSKGVLDTLKVSHTNGVAVGCCSPSLSYSANLCVTKSFIRLVLFLLWSDSDTAAESAHPGVKTPTFDRRRTSSQTGACQIWTPFGLSLQQHSGWSSLHLWVWVQPLCILPWKWPMQRQGEHDYMTICLIYCSWKCKEHHCSEDFGL